MIDGNYNCCKSVVIYRRLMSILSTAFNNLDVFWPINFKPNKNALDNTLIFRCMKIRPLFKY